MEFQSGILFSVRSLEDDTKDLSRLRWIQPGPARDMLLAINCKKVTEQILICALISPDNKNALFLDRLGHEYVIKTDDVKSKITYINSQFVKSETEKYKKLNYDMREYSRVMYDYVTNRFKGEKYKGWKYKLNGAILIK